MDDQDDVCWICLSSPNSPSSRQAANEGFPGAGARAVAAPLHGDAQAVVHAGAAAPLGQGPLLQPCACPRRCHQACLARWQLQQAGNSEETQCRFCGQRYPDWRPSLTPRGLQVPSAPLMAVTINGQVHKIRVQPGPEGQREFQRAIARLIGSGGGSESGEDSSDTEFDVIFECKAPLTGEAITLKGLAAFDAATHCAAVAAARRRQARLQQHVAIGKPPAAIPATDLALAATTGSAFQLTAYPARSRDTQPAAPVPLLLEQPSWEEMPLPAGPVRSASNASVASSTADAQVCMAPTATASAVAGSPAGPPASAVGSACSGQAASEGMQPCPSSRLAPAGSLPAQPLRSGRWLRCFRYPGAPAGGGSS